MDTKKILLVDDVKFFLELQKSFLKRTNCEILTASNGREGLELARKEHPDLILMDLYMPEMDGDEACKAIKSDPELKDIPVIMITKAGEGEEKGRCLLAGCDDFVTKPINRVALLEKVKNFLHVMIREHIRVPIDSEVLFADDGKEYSSELHDVSEGGLFICTEKPLPMGTQLNIKFKLPGSPGMIEVEGTVVRVVEKKVEHPVHVVPGNGIKFSRLSMEAKMDIIKYIKSGNYMV
ncbi:MAG: response regulator [bacterium]|nr:response regulator [bacterium]